MAKPSSSLAAALPQSVPPARDLQCLDLPVHPPRANREPSPGCAEPFALAVKPWSALQALADAERLEAVRVLASALGLLFSRHTNQHQIPIIVVDPEAPVARVLLVEARLSPETSFRNLAVGTAWVCVGEGAPSVLQVAVVLGRAAEAPAGCKLAFRLETGEQGLQGWIEDCGALVDPMLLARLALHMQTLLEAIAGEPDAPVWRLPMLAEPERHQLIVEWGEGELLGGEAACLHVPFLAQAARTPQATAIVARGERWSYCDLEEKSRALARRLRALGVGAEVRVGVYLARRPELFAALFAVLRAGGAYVPLDPDYPKDRIRFMLEDSRAAVVLTHSSLIASLPAGDIRCLFVDREEGAVGEGFAEDPDFCPPLPDNLAYLIYTSGSTGWPKGTAICHRSAWALVAWAAQRFTPAELAGTLASTSICFDLSVFEIFLPLAVGGALIVAENALDLHGLPAAGEVTLVNAVPAAVSELVRLGAIPPMAGTVALAGEALPRPLVDRLQALGTVQRIYNLYGPTEDTTYSTWARVEPAEGPPEIGRPLAGSRAMVLDAWLEPAPVEVPGELYLGGAGLARGYLGRPDLTAERFVPDPFGREPGGRLYRTGDLVRFLADGRLDCLGRLDHQIKVRGFRVEPGEVEAALAVHPQVEESAVLARPGSAGGYLVAYVVCARPAPPPHELRKYLAVRLPNHMVPSRFAYLDALPKTLNGKVDRRALAEIAPGLERAPGEAGRFHNAIEELLAGIWGEILQLEPSSLDREDNFFEMGGQSLLGVQVLARVRSLLGVELGLRDLLEAHTISALAKAVTVQRNNAHKLPPLLAVPRHGDLPASFAQERMWLASQLPGAGAYMSWYAPVLVGRLDVESLSQGLVRLRERHESLRTRFRDGSEGLVQIIDPPGDWRPGFIDLSGLFVEVRRREAARLPRQLVQRPFDLGKGPLLRAALLRLSPEEHVLLLSLHHAVYDGWSLGILFQELSHLYAAFQARKPPSLAPLPVQYPDFAVWQRSWLRGEVYDAELLWWRDQLGEVPPVLDLPADRPRRPVPAGRAGAVSIRLPEIVIEGVGRRARIGGVTPFMLLLAAFQALLHRHTGQERIHVGSPVAHRHSSEIEGLIGCLINTLVFCSDLSSNPAGEELLHRIREVALGAYEHQHFPFEKLVAHLERTREPGRSPLFQAMFVLQNTPPEALRLSGIELGSLGEAGISGGDRNGGGGSLEYDLVLHLREKSGMLNGLLSYREDLFDRTTALRLADHFERLVEGLVRHLDLRLAELPLLSAGERQQILVEWSEVGRLVAQDDGLRRELADRDANVRLILLGSHAEPVPLGTPGEVWLTTDPRATEGPRHSIGRRARFRPDGSLVWKKEGPSSALTVSESKRRSDLQSRKADLAARRARLVPNQDSLLKMLARTDKAALEQPIPRLPAAGRVRPSFNQERLWFLDQLEPGLPTYNIPVAFNLPLAARTDLLRRCLREIVLRHDSLRTTFSAADPDPLLRIAPPSSVTLPVADLSLLPVAVRSGEVRRLAQAEAETPFSLERGPLFRATLISPAGEGCLLLITLHHAISDAASISILSRELSVLYDAFLAGLPSPLPCLPIQYVDYAEWQRSWLAGEVLEAQINFWRERLAGASPELDLPLDRPRPRMRNGRGRTFSFELPSQPSQALRGLARRSGTTLFMAVLAVVRALLSRLAGQDDVVVGSPVSGRNRVELEPLIGFFVNTLTLRGDLSGAPSLLDLLARARRDVLEAHAWQDLPFERLVEELQPERSLGRSPLFQVLLVVEAGIGPSGGELGERSGRAKFDLTLEVQARERELSAGIEFMTDILDRSTVLRWAGHLATLLAGLVTSPDAPFSELSLLDESERAQILSEWSGDAVAVPKGPELLHARFVEQAVLRSAMTAVVWGEERWSYGLLDRESEQLAWRLRALGVGPEVRVGVCLERSPLLVTALLGVARAGGAYVPVDPRYPVERQAFLLEDSGVSVVLTQESLLASLPAGSFRAVVLDAPEDGDPVDPGPVAVSAGHLAYVIYTSGSTGHPKGVAIEHRSAASLVSWALEVFPAEDLSGVLASTSVCFDLSVFELFVPLSAGGTVVLAEDALALATLPAATEVRLINTVPSVLSELLTLEALPSSVRTVNLAGEALPRALAERIHDAGGERLFNLYGPSEDTTYSTWARIGRGLETPAIGRPLPGTRVCVLDGVGMPVPPGVYGELSLGGSGLSRGYLGRPELTAERFVPDPFGRMAGERLYRTGDRVRFGPDGDLEFLGRLDHQVKLRGFRIELGEVEAALRGFPGVLEAAVLVRDQRLIAFVSPSGEPNALRQALRVHLPDHMVPSAVVVLDALPKTLNGKVDRKALAVFELEESSLESSLPRTEIEAVVAGIWSEVLGRERVGLEESFFELGGHSLLATCVTSRLRSVFGVDLALRLLFETPTVAGLARQVETALRGGRTEAVPPLVRVPRTASMRLSFAQQRLWFLDQLEPGSAAYNIPMSLRLSLELNVQALSQAIWEVQGRHEVLRSRYVAEADEPVQVIDSAEPIRLSVVDLSGLPEPTRSSEGARLAGEEEECPFDLSRDPVLRCHLVRLGTREHVLLATFHHIASDGESLRIFSREVRVSYEALASGRSPDLPELRAQYADFAAWQRGWLSGEVLDRHLGFWRERLAGAPAELDLPLDRPRPRVRDGRGRTISFSLPGDLSALGRRCGVTLFMAVLAVVRAFLSRLSGQEDVVVGSPVSGRNRVELEPLIGFFVNTLALRGDLSGAPSLLELLIRARRDVLEGHAWQDLPFERLVEELQPERSLGRSPLFQVLLVVLAGVTRSGGALEERSGTAKFDLTLSMRETERGLSGGIEYMTDVLDRATVQRWVGHFGTLLSGLVSSPERPFTELPLLDEAEQEQILTVWSGAAAGVPGGPDLLHARFVEQAVLRPAVTAVVWGEERWSYGLLDRESKRLARRLRALGVGPEVRVGVCLERSPLLMMALLGVLRAGGAYVPVDPRYPAERQAFLLEDSGVSVVLTQESLVASLPAGSFRAVMLDGPEDGDPVDPGPVAVSAGHLAYVVYTSGSTGRPKGVAIEHRSAASLVSWALEVFPAEDLAGVLASTSVCFDLSVFELFVPLSAGGTVVLAENALALATLPAASEVRLVNMVPSVFSELLSLEAVPPSVRTVNLAGEALPRALANRVHAVGVERLFNLYGPSEDTTYSTWARIGRGLETPAIGRPLPGTRVYVLDSVGMPVLWGVCGELSLAGEGLSRGYLGRPELTAEYFVPDPFGRVAGGRLYRTGDRVRFRPDGDLEFLGRLDHQVKVRGFRIELREVEAALRGLQGVREAAVLVRDQSLIAFVSPEGEPDALRQALSAHLPDHMVPSAVVVLDTLPKTPNGKVDRKALAILELEESFVESSLPRTEIEGVVAGIWSEVLGRERVGLEESFFELGGHSLLATRVTSRLRSVFGVDLALRLLFETPTVAGLALQVETALRGGKAEAAPPLVRVPRTASMRLSFAQQRLWFLDQLEPGSAAYNIPTSLRLSLELKLEILAQAIGEVIRRHEVLRSRYVAEADEPVQVIHPPEPVHLPVVDLSDLPELVRSGEGVRLAGEEAERPFDLSQDPVLRCHLLRLGACEHVLLATFHHIASDGESLRIFSREVRVSYEALAFGRSPGLPGSPVQYADFSAWQRGWLSGEVLDRHLGFWRERLAGAPAELDLPLDRPRPRVRDGRGRTLPFEVRSEPSQALGALARRCGVTLFMAVLAVVRAFLSRLSGQEDVVVGSPVSGRNRVELEPLIGFFVNTLALRGDLSGAPSLLELLIRARRDVLEDHAWQDLPFERLVEELQPERSLGRSPLFQVLLVVMAEFTRSGGALEERSGTAKFDLTLSMRETERGLSGGIEYMTDVLDRATVQRWVGHFGTLLSGLVSSPERPFTEVPLLDEAEQEQILTVWSGAAAGAPGGPDLLHARFVEQAVLRPAVTAVVWGEERWSYGLLDRESERLAWRLRALGVGPEARVGVCLERSPLLVTALLGVLRAGGAYVPVDPRYPAERRAFLLADSGVSVVLTQESLLASLPAGSFRAVVLDALEDGDAVDPGPVTVSAGHLAYVIYTSGSTGRPKGVAIEHRSAASLVSWALEVFPAEDLAGVLASTSVCFDLSVFELFVPLSAGGTVVLAENALALATLPAVSEVRLVNTVPSAFSELLSLEAVPPSVRTVNLAGEVLPRALAERIHAVGVERLFNLYGPSEDTTYSTWARIGRSPRAPAIGRPLPGTRIYVLDGAGQPVPLGACGELSLGGSGLSRGYLGRPDLTAECFVPNPFGRMAGERLYRTGDRVRFGPDGDLEFLGRLDHQVKVRGFRIELGEVEAALRGFPGVLDAAVLVRDQRLIAFVSPGGEPDALRQALRVHLPDHMVPSAVVVLDTLPKTPNGKMDRKALAILELEESPVESSLPRTEIEGVVAGIWSEVLGREQVGAEESFFDLGGHSLLATRVTSRLRSVFGVDLALRLLFETPTVAGLARQVETALRGGKAEAVPPLVRVPRTASMRLSFAQQRLWFLDQLEPGSAAYNIPTSLRLSLELKVEILAQAIGEVIWRHEVLRSRYVAEADEPVQVIHPPEPVHLPVVDLSGLPEPARSSEGARLAGEEAERPFDLSLDPVLRCHLLRLGACEHVLLTTFHHIASDGESLRIFSREIRGSYEALASGRSPDLPELRAQYADFAAWQRGWLSGEVLDRHVGFWRERLAGVPAELDLPLDRPRPRVRDGRGRTLPFEVRSEPSQALGALARRCGVTLFMAVLAVVRAFLSRLSGQEDVVVGSPVSGRNRVELEPLIGFFVNTLALRGDLSRAPSLLELLIRARRDVLEDHAWQDLPFERLVEELQPERSLGRSPLFQVLLVVLAGVTRSGGALEERSGTAKFDLTLSMRETERGLSGGIEYMTDVLDRATVQRWTGHFGTLLSGLVSSPERPFTEVPLLDEAEQEQILTVWSGAAAGAPGGPDLLHARFVEQAVLRPAVTAVVWGEERWSYGLLDRESERLAWRLRALGVGPEARVGVCLERSPLLVTALLGVLRAGGAYVPVDPRYPAERRAFLLADSGVSVVLTQESLLASLPAGSFRAVVLDAPEGGDTVDFEPMAVSAGHLAYVIYTSGSTGRPKGVAIEHRSAASLVSWALEVFPAEDLAGALASTSVCFDLSVFELFVPLSAGGTVVLAENALALATLPAASEVRLVNTVPSVFSELLSLEAVPPSVRTVNLAGEALPRALAERIHAVGVERLFNLYGPSEDTTYSTWARIGQSPRAPAIGRPLPGTRIYVLDGAGQPVPLGACGELSLGGSGLSRGYLGRPDLTAERFVPNPFGRMAGERLYRTGDRVRFRPDGDLEFLGRLDHQVKVRGFRIELGEVEAALRGLQGVREAAVLVRDQRLIAFVSPEGEPDALRQALSAHLPDHMVPSAVVVLDTLPKTLNGKVDRKALATLELEESFVESSLPRTEIEGVVAGIWSEVLCREQVGVEESFFDLGGHSLLATRVTSRLRSVFGVDLALRLLFETPTVAGLARQVETALRGGRTEAVPPLVRVPRTASMPLSFAQQRLWFLDQLEPGSAAYNIPMSLRLSLELNVQALSQAIWEVQGRHEVLRTRYVAEDDEPVQVIHSPEPFHLPVVDLSDLPELVRSGEGGRLAGEEAERPFDLSQDPVLRCHLLRLGACEHVLLATFHHIASDGEALRIFSREIRGSYEALASGRSPDLPELRAQYADFAAWQRGWLSGEVLDRHLGFWRERLAGVPAELDLPLDRPRPRVRDGRGRTLPYEVRSEPSQALGALARRCGVTLFMAVLAVVRAFLSRLSGQEDVVVGSPVSGRNRVELEPLIGFFVNTLALRGDLSGAPSLQELLIRARRDVLEGHAWQDLPFERLVEELQPERSLGRSPLFQVLLVVLAGVARSGGESGEQGGTAKFDLTLSMWETERGLSGGIEYMTDVLDRATVQRWIGHFGTLLSGLVSSPERPFTELPLLDEAEQEQILTVWSGAAEGAPAGGPALLHDRFVEQAGLRPAVTALVWGEERWSYGLLDRESKRLAQRLRALGVGPEVRVGVCLERSPLLVTALLGVLRAGGAYVPVDPRYPAERQAFLLADSGVSVVLTQESLLASLPAGSFRAVVLDAPEDGDPVDPGPVAVSAGHLAYVIYTSGSTGRSKGVAIEHRSAASLVSWALEVFPAEDLAGVLASTSVCFDLSVFELFVPLSAGGTVVLAENALALATLPAVSEVRLVNTVPSAFSELLGLEAVPPSVRTVNLAGEALPHDLAKRIHDAGVERLFNLYGPSEDTTYSTWARIGRSPGAPAIGRPLPGTRIYVLDGAGQPVPLGVCGELSLAGEGLSRGYLGRPELTAEYFVPDPFGRVAGGRLYRTGDRVRFRPDGDLEFLGRLDHQVKVRGFRIELGEVEAALRGLQGVREAAVLVRDQRLIAFVSPGGEPNALRRALSAHLPDHMVPSAVVVLDTLPKTPNGKMDRKALAVLETEELRQRGDFLAPRDHFEQKVAEILENLLGVRPVGALDDFFDLGGHSLLAVRLQARIRRDLGRNLPLAELFQFSTVERIAMRLRSGATQDPRETLVELRRGHGYPLFCIHPAGGNVFCYLELARSLGADQPVYGLQTPDPGAARRPAALGIEALAAFYLETLRDLQPQGPYAILGWSMGGLIAYEMARQLDSRGEKAEPLILIDVPAPEVLESRDDLAESDLFEWFLRDLSEGTGLVPPDLSPTDIDHLFSRFRANIEALLSYGGGVYLGNLLLFRATHSITASRGPSLGWEFLVQGDLDVRELPGDHYSVLRSLTVAELARQIKPILSQRGFPS